MDDRPRLLDLVRQKIRLKHYSLRTEKVYVDWIRRYIFFHQKRHPRDLSAGHIEQFLTHLAVDRQVSASTQNQALSALLFLYKQVLEIDIPFLGDMVRAKPSKHLPVVFTQEEAQRVIAALEPEYVLPAKLLYGSGLRLMECLRAGLGRQCGAQPAGWSAEIACAEGITDGNRAHALTPGSAAADFAPAPYIYRLFRNSSG